MRPPRRFLVRSLVLAAFAGACAEEAPVPHAEPVDACPLSEPQRLAAPAPGWRRDPQIFAYVFTAAGDRLLYSFDPIAAAERDYWLVDRCGGAPERLLSLDSELFGVEAVTTAAGPVVYARDLAGARYVIDRLDVPGVDGPVAVEGLPAADYHVAVVDGLVVFSAWNEPIAQASSAAAIGGTLASEYVHDGDPGRAAWLLGDAIVQTAARDGRELVLDDAGELREVELATGASSVMIAGVRSFDLAPGDRHLVWQEIGDDVAEQVHLRDLDTGVERPLAVNDFAAMSWGRDPASPRAGLWLWTDDSGVALQVGPEEVIVGAFRTDTGEALAIPEHTGFGARWDHEVNLIRDTDDEHAELAWDPRSGELRAWYRGPLNGGDPAGRRLEGELLEYFLPDAADPGNGTLWRVDLATGEAAMVLPRVNRHYDRLDDGRYLVRRHDLAVADPSTLIYTPVAAQPDSWRYFPDQGLVYLDSEGPAPGLWAAPLPAP